MRRVCVAQWKENTLHCSITDDQVDPESALIKSLHKRTLTLRSKGKKQYKEGEARQKHQYKPAYHFHSWNDGDVQPH